MAISNKSATSKASRTGARKPKGAASSSRKPKSKNTIAATKAARHGVRENSKLAIVVAMLRAPKGSTIEELSNATGWQTHSVRGAMSGTIKKKLGLTILSVKTDGVRTYRIGS